METKKVMLNFLGVVINQAVVIKEKSLAVLKSHHAVDMIIPIVMKKKEDVLDMIQLLMKKVIKKIMVIVKENIATHIAD